MIWLISVIACVIFKSSFSSPSFKARADLSSYIIFHTSFFFISPAPYLNNSKFFLPPPTLNRPGSVPRYKWPIRIFLSIHPTLTGSIFCSNKTRARDLNFCTIYVRIMLNKNPNNTSPTGSIPVTSLHPHSTPCSPRWWVEKGRCTGGIFRKKKVKLKKINKWRLMECRVSIGCHQKRTDNQHVCDQSTGVK